MIPTQILQRLDEQEALEFLQRLVRVKSYPDSDGERVLAEMLVSEMHSLGLDAELQPVPLTDGQRVNAIGKLSGTGGGKSLLFNGHIDTNPVTEGWTVDPWAGLVDERFIYGIGVSNMKAGVAAYYCAVRTLVDAGVRLRGDVVLTFVVGELQGGVGTLAAIQSGLRADYFINSEPTDLQAMTMHAAACTPVIELTGVTRHMSKREESVDALAAASELIPRLNKMKFSDARSPEHLSINRMHIGVAHAALGRELHEWRSPQVADFVRLKGSARFAPGQTLAGVSSDITAELAESERGFPGLKAELSFEPMAGQQFMPGFEVSRDSRIVSAINRAYSMVRGESQPTGAVTPPAFYGTDAGHLYTELGMEGVVCGPGGRYNTMPDERVDLVDYLDMIRMYILTIIDVCEAE